MRPEDVKIGMIVSVDTDSNVLYKIISNVTEINKYFCVTIEELSTGTIYKAIDVNIFIPVEQPEFTWDKSVPTVGEPFKHNSSWYIAVDGTKSVTFNPSIIVKDMKSDNFESYKLCAIVPNSKCKFILESGYGIFNNFVLPVTYTPKEREVTMKEVEEKFGCKIKIKAEV